MKIILPVVAAAAVVIYFVRRNRRTRVILMDEQARVRSALSRVRKIAEDHKGDDEAIRRELNKLFEAGEMAECVSPEMDLDTIVATLERAIADQNKRADIERTFREER